ncbi:FecR domain-containing protein [Stenotrophomonas sp. 24(2023)]|uniref:FecR family protein n=1 Tax=Stenotrophomonas sp. 24(2023) TaxID=3068324 RepID=UPI0027DECDA3|nr:FecR domain-containing protein [Stenotrophomonas sp. 24(2023)]WMJ70607.1 FecR domain-containing protein [Stenotrophomonas sp. 24(2023)]
MNTPRDRPGTRERHDATATDGMPTPAVAATPIDRHRDALRQLFPMPDAQALRPARRTPALAGTAAGCLLALVGLYAWDPGLPASDIQTAPGERRALVLADGSRLTVDGGSHVRVQRHLFSRRVALLEGRARFAVVSSHWRRFQVDAGPVQVRNYGTVFDVSRRGARSEVMLWRGSVGVRVPAQGDEQRLQPGQQVSAGPDGVGRPMPITAGQQDWPQGRLQFSATPLVQVLAELQRYHAGRIVLDDPTLGTLAVSGVFDSDRSATALALLPDILPVVVQAGDDGSVHIQRRPP